LGVENVTNINVTAVDHVYVAVSDIERSERFYDNVMRLLNFRKGTKPIAGEKHLHYFNRVTQYSIRPAHSEGKSHDPYSPGLHHLCFRVESTEEVDVAATELGKLGIVATAPRYYPEYAPDYYATFFEDPDGIRLEVVAMRELRRLLKVHWHELTEFEDPLKKAGLVR
jgi:catechol 2,3-dioxygenase-like lactoylglutathione lyase family enzyme